MKSSRTELAPIYTRIMIACNCFFMCCLFHPEEPASFNAEKPAFSVHYSESL